MENTPDRLHPLMTVTALAVTAAALATVGVITGVIPERAAPAAPAGAAAATFATRLAADPLGIGPTLYAPQPLVRACEDCATVESVRRLAKPGYAEQGADQWEIRVRMEDGTMLTLAAESQPSWHAGQHVRLVDGVLMSM
ncbi:MAG: hypothetical protein HZA64_14815 [Rhodocyclales bacterium]|nr:hypothetical protein [Rhodocyclales bacterium]